MIFLPCEQGTEEWLLARAGLITASRAKDARSRLQRKSSDRNVGDFSDAALKYAWQVASERIAKKPLDNTFETWAMKRGTAIEPVARTVYEARFGVLVEPEGIVLDDNRIYGYSTDGRVEGENGGVEIKCPIANEKIGNIWLAPEVAEFEYEDQIRTGLLLTEWDWIDLVVYVPWLNVVGKDLFVKRIWRDENKAKKLQEDLHEFRLLVDGYEAVLREPAPKMFSSAKVESTQLPLPEEPVTNPAVVEPPAPEPVVPKTPEPASTPSEVDDSPRISLGMIHDRLGFQLSQSFIETVLGIKSSVRIKNSVLYKPSDWKTICDKLATHVFKLADEPWPLG